MSFITTGGRNKSAGQVKRWLGTSCGSDQGKFWRKIRVFQISKAGFGEPRKQGVDGRCDRRSLETLNEWGERQVLSGDQPHNFFFNMIISSIIIIIIIIVFHSFIISGAGIGACSYWPPEGTMSMSEEPNFYIKKRRPLLATLFFKCLIHMGAIPKKEKDRVWGKNNWPAKQATNKNFTILLPSPSQPPEPEIY